MTLSDFLRSQPRGAAARFARDLGTNQANVSRWTQGQAVPSSEWVEAIVRLSDGKVSVADLLPDLAAAIAISHADAIAPHSAPEKV